MSNHLILSHISRDKTHLALCSFGSCITAFFFSLSFFFLTKGHTHFVQCKQTASPNECKHPTIFFTFRRRRRKKIHVKIKVQKKIGMRKRNLWADKITQNRRGKKRVKHLKSMKSERRKKRVKCTMTVGQCFCRQNNLFSPFFRFNMYAHIQKKKQETATEQTERFVSEFYWIVCIWHWAHTRIPQTRTRGA